jgi:hypothetical protein
MYEYVRKQLKWEEKGGSDKWKWRVNEAGIAVPAFAEKIPSIPLHSCTI